MSIINLPYTFVGGTRAIADQVNADFQAVINGVNNNVRIALATPTTFYVAPAGVDAPGNGLSPVTPAATITYIFNLLSSSYDLNRMVATIQLADGDYTESVNIAGPLPGQTAASALTIQGNMASASNVRLAGNPCFNVHQGGLCAIQGIHMSSTTSHCILSQYHARVVHQANIFGQTAGAHLFSARAGSIQSVGNYTISGNAGWAHVYAQEAGEAFIDTTSNDYMNIPIGNPTVTLSATPTFGIAFAVSHNVSIVGIAAAFAGSGATGVRFSTNYNGSINIHGQDRNTYLPGNAPGTDNTGGITG